MSFIVFNGELSKRDTITVDIEDRGYQFGDGIYEVVRVYNGCLFTWKEHVERLYASAEKIRMTIPYTMEEMKVMMDKLIEKNQLIEGTIYLQLTRGIAPRNHAFPGSDVQAVLVAYTRLGERPVKLMEEGVDALIIEDKRWLHCDIKSLNLLGNVLAHQEALDAGCYEAILHRDGVITEGSHTNVSIVSDGTVYTHPANNLILNGISRRVMLKACESQSIPFKEEAFTVDQLMRADEVFITSTTLEITPVRRINGQPAGVEGQYPVIRQLQESFTAAIETECGSLR
ncbi:D-amino-acid transaminase [Pradoshia sp.]